MATKKAMENINIHNPHNYAKGEPFIFYSPQQTGRAWRGAEWCIHWKDHPFPGPWYNHDDFVIDIFRPRFEKELKLEEAKEKFYELFGDEELVPTPFGSWMKKSFVEKRNKEIKEMLKKNK